MQGCQYTCVVETAERVVLAVGSDRKIKELADGGNGMQVPEPDQAQARKMACAGLTAM